MVRRTSRRPTHNRFPMRRLVARDGRASLAGRLAAPAEPGPRLLAEPALPRPGLAFRRIAQRSRSDALVVRDAEIILFEAADLVAEAPGFLELEVSGGLAHALLEVRDVSLEVVSDEMRPIFVAGVDDHAVARRH